MLGQASLCVVDPGKPTLLLPLTHPPDRQKKPAACDVHNHHHTTTTNLPFSPPFGFPLLSPRSFVSLIQFFLTLLVPFSYRQAVRPFRCPNYFLNEYVRSLPGPSHFQSPFRVSHYLQLIHRRDLSCLAGSSPFLNPGVDVFPSSPRLFKLLRNIFFPLFPSRQSLAN